MDMGQFHEDFRLSEIEILLPADLQLFSEEKTEKATDKKRREAREKGQVVQSKDLTGAIQFFAVILSINFLKTNLFERIFRHTKVIFQLMETPHNLSEISFVSKLMEESIKVILLVTLPLMGIAMISAVAVIYFQVGFLFTTKPLMPKLDKINPISGFKRLFSMRSLVELIKSILKSSILLIVTGSYLLSRQKDLLSLLNMNTGQILFILWDIVYNLMLRTVALLLVLGVADYAYKIWQNEKDLRMSKQEIKDEYKMTEGDPQLKGKIKQKQREISMGRMMQEVPKADVIITNPTHFAVAISYDPQKSDAPTVVAKGKDLVAQRIKNIANENEIPIVENKPMARALYAQVEWGQAIPETLYHGVAEILAYVYGLKEGKEGKYEI